MVVTKNYIFLQDKTPNSIFLPINALFLQLIPQRLTNIGHPPSLPFDSTSGWPSTKNNDGPNVQQHITSSKEMDNIMLAEMWWFTELADKREYDFQ